MTRLNEKRSNYQDNTQMIPFSVMTNSNIARDKLHGGARLQSLAIHECAKRLQQQHIHADRRARRVDSFAQFSKK